MAKLDQLLGRGSRRAQDNEDDEDSMESAAAEQQAQDDDDEDSMASSEAEQQAQDDDDEDSMAGDHDEDRAQAKARPRRSAKSTAQAHRLAERKRIAAIVECDAAQGREKSALKLALKTDMSPAQAAEMLAELPKDGGKAFADAMAAQGNPDLGPAGDGSGAGGAGGEASTLAGQIQAAAKKARPYGHGGRRPVA